MIVYNFIFPPLDMVFDLQEKGEKYIEGVTCKQNKKFNYYFVINL